MADDLIIDAGMHKGEDTAFYLKKGFRVVAIEANPDLCARVETELEPYCASGQLKVINAAIVKNAGPVAFYINNDKSEWGTTQQHWVERNEQLGSKSRKITVAGIQFKDILKTHGIPYYLKVDIEGNDLLCLEALLEAPSKPKHISIESTKTSWRDLLREFELFRSLGYSRFKIVDQRYVPEHECPDPAREGIYTEHRFERFSTGLFGEEAPGAWMSQARALWGYRMIFFEFWLIGDDGVIPRLHHLVNKSPRSYKKFIRAGWYDTHASR